MSSAVEEEEEAGDTLGSLGSFKAETRPKKQLKKVASKNSYYFSSLPDLRVQNSDGNAVEDVARSKSATDMKKKRSTQDSASGLAGTDNRSFRKNKRKGKHLVHIEVLDGFVEKTLGGIGNTVDDVDDEDDDGRPSLRSVSTPENLNSSRGHRSASVSGVRTHHSQVEGIVRQKSSSDVLARAGKNTNGISSSRSIYFCEVLYDGVQGQSAYGEEDIDVSEVLNVKHLSQRKVNKSKASTSWKSVHTINVRKVVADIGLRYAIVRVKKKTVNSVLSNTDAVIGSFRVPFGGLRKRTGGFACGRKGTKYPSKDQSCLLIPFGIYFHMDFG